MLIKKKEYKRVTREKKRLVILIRLVCYKVKFDVLIDYNE